MGTSGAEPGAAERASRSLAWRSGGLPGHPALLSSELPGWMPWGCGGHSLPRPRAMAPSSQQDSLWLACQCAGREGEVGGGGKGNAEWGQGQPWTERPLSVPQATGGLIGATELRTAWRQEVWGHLLVGSGHPVCPSSGTAWWAIPGPVAFPPLAIAPPQRGLSSPSQGSLPGLSWGRDLPGPERAPRSGLEESWCDPGGASSGVGGCQGSAGGMRKWALTVSPPRSWGRQGLTLS